MDDRLPDDDAEAGDLDLIPPELRRELRRKLAKRIRLARREGRLMFVADARRGLVSMGGLLPDDVRERAVEFLDRLEDREEV